MAASATAPCWAGIWRTTGVWLARPWARQGHRGYRKGPGRDRAMDRTARDPAKDDTARDDHSFPTPCPASDDTARDAHPSCRAQRRAIRHATSSTGRCDRRQTIRHATILSCPEYARICPDMPGYARICPLMFSYVLTAWSLRLRGLFGTVYRDASGPTPRLSRAANGQ